MDQWPPQLADLFKKEMRQALDGMDLQRVQSLRTFFEKVEQALPAQQVQQQQPSQPFLGKTADIVYDQNQLHTPEHIPQPSMQPLENEVRDPGVIKCACGNVLAPGVEFCPNCGTHKGIMQQNPLEWPIAKVGQLIEVVWEFDPGEGDELEWEGNEPQFPPAQVEVPDELIQQGIQNGFEDPVTGDDIVSEWLSENYGWLVQDWKLPEDDNPTKDYYIAKTAELADEPQASQPTDQQPPPLPTAPNPAMMGDDAAANKIVQNPQELAKQEIADEAAARTFSQLANLDTADQIVQSLAEAYGLDPTEVQSSLAVQATFGDVIAINGDVTKVDINRTEFEEVNPSSAQDQAPENDFSQGIVPPAPESEGNTLTNVDKAAKVPLQLIIDKIMQEQNVDEQQANDMLKDGTWGDIPIPTEFNVPVQGELKFFLPTSMVGAQQVTNSPFQQDQRPEDIMDQEYNSVPMQPAH